MSYRPYRIAIWGKTEGICWYCGVNLTPFNFTTDHVIPISSEEGSSAFWNMVPCCKSCNSSKGSRTLDQFRAVLLKKQGAIFTERQLTYWQERGIELPIPQPHVFYFEKVGLG